MSKTCLECDSILTEVEGPYCETCYDKTVLEATIEQLETQLVDANRAVLEAYKRIRSPMGLNLWYSRNKLAIERAQKAADDE